MDCGSSVEKLKCCCCKKKKHPVLKYSSSCSLFAFLKLKMTLMFLLKNQENETALCLRPYGSGFSTDWILLLTFEPLKVLLCLDSAWLSAYKKSSIVSHVYDVFFYSLLRICSQRKGQKYFERASISLHSWLKLEALFLCWNSIHYPSQGPI